MNNIETTWNEAIFDDVTESDRETLNRAMENGDLAEFEPDEDVYEMDDEIDVINHAHDTRDAFLNSSPEKNQIDYFNKCLKKYTETTGTFPYDKRSGN